MEIESINRENRLQAYRIERIVTLVSNGEMNPDTALFLYPEIAEAIQLSGLFELSRFSIIPLQKS